MNKKFGKLYIEYIYKYIINCLEKQNNLYFNFTESDFLKEIIENEIFKRSFKSLLYCMNLRRTENKLIGKTPEDRYSWFCNNQYSIDSMEEIFPQMKEQLYEEIKEKCTYIISVINLFQSNKLNICQYFFQTDNEKIVKIENVGDWHNNKCVLIITFASDKRIVYKSTKGDNLNFLKELTGYFFEDDYVKQYDCMREFEGEWVKFVEHEEIFEKDLINQFYYNYGKIAFVAYLLGMNDMHYENVISHGVYPVITDVETIFSSYLFFDTHEFEYDAQYKAVQKLLYGIASTGLIPILSMTEYFGGDVSCLSNKGIRIIAEKVKNEFRDDMCIYTEQEVVTQYNHLPNKDIDPLLYSEAIVKGFAEARKIFENNKNNIIKYILENLTKLESRIILNMTKGYSQILRIKNDPKYRNNPSLFSKLLVNLKRNNQFNKNVYIYEAVELNKGNIPSFYWNLSTNHVYGYNGETAVKIINLHRFDKEKAHSILEYQTSSQMLGAQENLIQDSIMSSLVLNIKYKNKDTYTKYNVRYNKSLKENIDENRVIGDDGTISWIGLMVNDKEQLEYAVLDWSLYSGLTGIGYMYIAEYLYDKNEFTRSIIEKIYRTINKAFDIGKFNDQNISYYCGLTGLYAFLTKVKEYKILKNHELDETLTKIKELIKKNVIKTSIYDTLSGIHSAVVYFFKRSQRDIFAKEMIKKLSDYFTANFDLSIMSKDFNYASFAHGYSGIITSIMCLNRANKNDILIRLGQELWEKENKLYKEKYLWLDLRSQEETYSHFWCHGSCGIMYSRLIWKKWSFLNDGIINLSESNLDKGLLQYIELIISNKLNTQNYSLCHGNFAFIDFLIAYENIFGKEDENKVTMYILKTIENAKRQGYSCVGAPGAINAIGLMVGESGIQYMLKRCENSTLPSVLAAEGI